MVDFDRFMAVGDVHGDIRHWAYLLSEADRHEISVFLQVGDYGYWPHTADGDTYLNLLEEHLAADDRQCYWIDGNHENHTWLRHFDGPEGEKHETNAEGFWKIRPHIFYIPRGHRWTWHGVSFLGLGGAFSIDWEWRQEAMIKKARYKGVKLTDILLTKHALWWPEEMITEEEKLLACEGGQVDVVVSHDCPSFIDLNTQMALLGRGFFKGDEQTVANRARLTYVFDRVRPQHWYFGHYHIRCSERIDMCNFEALAANIADGWKGWTPAASWTIVHLDDLKQQPTTTKESPP